VREQDSVHELLQARTVADEMQQPTSTFPLGTHARIGQPDRRHQVTARQLGEHPGVDSVGLAGERCESFHLLRVGDLDLPSVELERVVHEPRAVHRFDRGADRFAVASKTLAQSVQAASIRCDTRIDGRTLVIELVVVRTEPGSGHGRRV
jgi:hypothetical protein